MPDWCAPLDDLRQRCAEQDAAIEARIERAFAPPKPPRRRKPAGMAY